MHCLYSQYRCNKALSVMIKLGACTPKGYLRVHASLGNVEMFTCVSVVHSHLHQHAQEFATPA